MGKLLTREEFLQVTEDIHYLTVDSPDMRAFQRDLIRHWIERNCNACWAYWDQGDKYAFGSLSDFTMFKMWVRGNPLKNKDDEYEGVIS